MIINLNLYYGLFIIANLTAAPKAFAVSPCQRLTCIANCHLTICFQYFNKKKQKRLLST